MIWLGKSDPREIIKEIQRLQKEEHKSKANLLRVKVEIGDALIELKRATKHGDWKSARDEVGYNNRTAQRLMRLSGRWLGEEIRTQGTHLTKSLPVDLQKLDILGRLSPKQFEDISGEWPCLETMSRSELRRRVNALLELGQSGELQETVRIQPTTAAAVPPSAVRTLCQAAITLKSSASKLDPSELDKAIGTLQDVLQFLRKTRRSRSRKPNTAVIPPVNVPLDSTLSPANS